VDHNWRHADGRDAVCRRGGARVHAAERQLRATAGCRRRRDDYMLQSGNYEQQLVVIGIAVLGRVANREAIKNGSFSIDDVETVRQPLVPLPDLKTLILSTEF